ncbi:hypothetical protein L195_g061283, partial [Trifolium pratense]
MNDDFHDVMVWPAIVMSSMMAMNDDFGDGDDDFGDGDDNDDNNDDFGDGDDDDFCDDDE